MKRALKSKTIVTLFLIAVGKLLPGGKEFIFENWELVVVIDFLIAVILRKLTKEPISFKMKDLTLSVVLSTLLLASCAGIPQKLDPEVFYKRDLPVCLKDVGCFEGAAVFPDQTTYEFDIAPKGEASIDLLLVNSCHREETFEKTATGWWIFKNKSRFKYYYSPVAGLEDTGDCSVRINTLEKTQGRHAWFVARFENKKYTLPASVFCNGEKKDFHGVSICQSKRGLIQRIKFNEPVMIEADPNCPMPKKAVDGAYEWNVSIGECGYSIISGSGKKHDLLAIGYDGVLIREIK